jgi:hypothetical protein
LKTVYVDRYPSADFQIVFPPSTPERAAKKRISGDYGLCLVNGGGGSIMIMTLAITNSYLVFSAMFHKSANVSKYYGQLLFSPLPTTRQQTKISNRKRGNRKFFAKID